MIVQPIIGPAGVGKSTFVIREVLPKLESQGTRSLLLSFNRDLRLKAMEKTKGFACVADVHTVHSLAYSLLRPHGLVPTGISKADIEEAPLSKASGGETKSAKSQGFDDLIRLINDTEGKLLSELPTDIGAILVDEYQDLREDLVAMVRKVAEYLGADVYLVGDPNQTIYTYRNEKNALKVLPNFELIEKDWHGFDIAEPVFLRENHRSKPNILKSVNAFLENVGTASALYSATYEIPETAPNERGPKPIIGLFGTQEEEYQWVTAKIEEIRQIEQGRIVILAQYQREMVRYQEWVSDMGFSKDEMVVRTVFQHKGLEDDTVILVGTDIEPSKGMTERHLNAVFYVAITRPKKRLIVTSGHPSPKLEALRGHDSWESRGRQSAARRKPLWTPKLDTNARYTPSKIAKSHIDSIEVGIKAADAPFKKYVERGVLPHDKGSFIQGFIDDSRPDEPKMTVLFDNSHKQYKFYFLDIGLLTRNGYTDEQKVRYILNRVSKFFDYRVDPSKVEAKEIHLARLISMDSLSEAHNLFRKIIDWFKGSKGISVRTHDNFEYPLEAFNPLPRHWGSTTYYLNCRTRKENMATLAVYSPRNKQKGNKNGISSQYSLKLEWRLKSSTIDNKYALGESRFVSDLLRLTGEDSDYLGRVYDSVSRNFKLSEMALVSRENR